MLMNWYHFVPNIYKIKLKKLLNPDVENKELRLKNY